MQYVDGNPVRGNMKQEFSDFKRTGWQKAGDAVGKVSYMIGLASTAKEVYTAARPVLQGAGLLI